MLRMRLDLSRQVAASCDDQGILTRTRSEWKTRARSGPAADDLRGLVERVDDLVRLALGVPDLLDRDVAVRQVDRLQAGVPGSPDVVEEPVADVDTAAGIGRTDRL